MNFTIRNIKFHITFYFMAIISFMLTFNAPYPVLLTVLFSIVHECGHLIAMIISKNKPKKVIFEITGMNIVRTENTNISFKNECIIALGGPFINLLLFFIFYIVYLLFKNKILLEISCINLIIMIFNILPVKRLDGGMALYFLLSKYFDTNICGKILNITSLIFLLLIYWWGIYVFISGNYNFTVIIIAIFLTLSMLGDNEY